MYSWTQSTHESTNDQIRCWETARKKKTRISTADITEMLATPQKNASHSIMRLKNSSERSTSRTTFATGAPSPSRTSTRQNLLLRSELSSADRTSPGKRKGPRTVISERPGKGRSRLQAISTSGLLNKSEVRRTRSPSVKRTHVMFVTRTVMH